MSDNLDELKQLVAALKADQQAQKDKEKRDAWTKYVSLSMICLAVLAAVATQRGAGFSSTQMRQLNEATFNQSQASDQWAYYQAKGIKQNLYELELERVGSSDAKQQAALTARVTRYDKEKKEISDIAKGLEAKRDVAREAATKAADGSRGMGLAVSIFQIAIALGGITLVIKKRWLWYISMLGGILATLQMLHVMSAN
ncbi:MAG TPA: DUF4337 domain-containing protein [Lacunisphaera sp.]